MEKPLHGEGRAGFLFSEGSALRTANEREQSWMDYSTGGALRTVSECEQSWILFSEGSSLRTANKREQSWMDYSTEGALWTTGKARNPVYQAYPLYLTKASIAA